MATVILDNCQMETTTQGTGSYTVSALTGRDDIMTLNEHKVETNIADLDLVYACIRQQGVGGSAEWGLYTFNDNGGGGADTLDRTTIQGSTDGGGGAITWGAGTKTVTICLVGQGGLVIAANNGSDFTNLATFRTNTDVPQLSANGSDFTATTFRANVGAAGDADINTFTSLNTFSGGSVNSLATLTDAITITWDATGDNVNAHVIITASRALGAISNVVAGMVFNLIVQQDGVGGFALTYHANYKFSGGVAPVIATGVNAISVLSIVALSTTELLVVSSLDFS